VSQDDSREDSKQAGGEQIGGPTAQRGAVPPSFGASQPAPAPTQSAGTQPAGTQAAATPGTAPPLVPVPVAQPQSPGLPTGSEPAAGWYPPAPEGYSPAAGPLAGGSAAGRGGVVGGRLATWGSSRGKLLNTLLFGVAPLCLAGIVIIAFVLSSPGKGEAASKTGFRAGAAASSTAVSQDQDVSAPTSGSPSPTPGKSTSHPGKKKSAQLGTLSSGGSGGSGGHKSTPPPASRHTQRPKPKSSKSSPPASSAVVPADLGAPNFSGYCQHIGQGSALSTASNAYGWHCSANPSLTISVQGACAWTFNLSAGQVINVSTDYYSASSWQCWRTNGILGQLDIATYCTAAGLGSAKLAADNAYGWSCTDQATINTTAACQLVYHNSNAFARFAVFGDPYSWQCWD
jgi:hypothetical protein